MQRKFQKFWVLLEHWNDENWQIREKKVYISVLSFFCYSTFWLWIQYRENCFWSLNFVVFRFLHGKILFFLSFSRDCKFYSFLFLFVPRLFKYIPVTNLSFFEQSTFLSGAATTICHFFHRSIYPSVAHQISETIHYLTVIFGTHI